MSAPPRAAHKPSSTRPTTTDLAEEVAVLDLARQATQGQKPLRALELLDSYLRLFPHGLLVPEATVLRIEALSASEQKAAAQALALELLAAAPTSPHAERLRAVASGEAVR